MDTGDLVHLKHSPIREYWIVACAHGAVVHVCGLPSNRCTYRLDDLELVREATYSERRAQLEALAQGSGTGHRPVCARARLAALAVLGRDGDG